MMEYYRRLKEDRLAQPTDDLYSALVNAKIEGEPIGDMELVSYFLILTSAGSRHHPQRARRRAAGAARAPRPTRRCCGTTRRAAPPPPTRSSGGRARSSSSAARPVEDLELGGRQIQAGETMAMFYPSANRDEDGVRGADEFRVTRDPNPHLALGVGEHYCLGAHLARTEIRILLEELVPRLDRIELAGPVERTAAAFVGGVKHLPVRWSLRPTADR